MTLLNTSPTLLAAFLVVLQAGERRVDAVAIQQTATPSAEDEEEKRFAAELRRRIDAIQAEVAQGQAPAWAGEYHTVFFIGPGGESLSLSPQHGFTWEESGCFRYDANYGDIIQRDEVSVTVQLVRERSGCFGRPTSGVRRSDQAQLFLVPWGEAWFLVPENWMVGFCNQVNGGLPPHTRARSLAEHVGTYIPLHDRGRKLIEESPESFPLTALRMPTAWRDWILPSPINARVIEAEKPKRIGPAYEGSDSIVFKQRSRIEAGLDRGLRAGMWMYRNTGECLEVIEVEPTSAWVMYTFSLPRDEYPRPPAVGEVISTKLPPSD